MPICRYRTTFSSEMLVSFLTLNVIGPSMMASRLDPDATKQVQAMEEMFFFGEQWGCPCHHAHHDWSEFS